MEAAAIAPLAPDPESDPSCSCCKTSPAQGAPWPCCTDTRPPSSCAHPGFCRGGKRKGPFAQGLCCRGSACAHPILGPCPEGCLGAKDRERPGSDHAKRGGMPGRER